MQSPADNGVEPGRRWPLWYQPLAAGLLALGLLSTAHAQTAAPSPAGCATLGVIRWDAWFGAKGAVGSTVEKTLGPSRWHDRLPVCASKLGPDAVRIRCEGDDQMATEIEQAANAGIGYFAFLAYPANDPMSLGLQSYLKAPNRKKLGFALISEMDRWGGQSLYKPVIARYVQLMREPGYQKTPDGRPLFYLGFVTDAAITKRFGSRAGYRAAVDEFRGLVKQAGLADPYIVLMHRLVPQATSLVKDLGLDAVSAYAVADSTVQQGSYRQLTDLVEGFWRDATAAGLSLVPPVMTGWDRRPRVLNPTSWEPKVAYSDEQMLRYFNRPTMAELEAHVAKAIQVASDPAKAPARSVLTYAWNEFDEGDWLAPTQGEGTARLEAVRRAVDRGCPAAGGTASGTPRQPIN